MTMILTLDNLVQPPPEGHWKSNLKISSAYDKNKLEPREKSSHSRQFNRMNMLRVSNYNNILLNLFAIKSFYCFISNLLAVYQVFGRMLRARHNQFVSTVCKQVPMNNRIQRPQLMETKMINYIKDSNLKLEDMILRSWIATWNSQQLQLNIWTLTLAKGISNRSSLHKNNEF